MSLETPEPVDLLHFLNDSMPPSVLDGEHTEDEGPIVDGLDLVGLEGDEAIVALNELLEGNNQVSNDIKSRCYSGDVVRDSDSVSLDTDDDSLNETLGPHNYARRAFASRSVRFNVLQLFKPPEQNMSLYDQPATPLSPGSSASGSTEHVGTGMQRALHQITQQQLDKNRRNADAAKQNREKKKQQFRQLEEENERLRNITMTLHSQHVSNQRKMQDQENEITYLRSILDNDSEIGKYLHTLTRTHDIKVNVRSPGQKRPATATGAARVSKRAKKEGATASVGGGAGICMHIGGGVVSFAACSLCAEKAARG